jgi:HPt (histidine-containing phosphotransfer) domain-containing protein
VSALDPATVGQLSAALPPEELARILLTFEADIGRLAGEFTSASDEDAARRAAHSLAGTAAAIGALRLASLARHAMDRAAMPDPAILSHELRRETDTVLAELARLVARLNGAAG